MTVSPTRKKLIEVSIPLEAINKASAREKSIRHGHPSTLHLWWARRPLAACRAVLFSQLVDDPSAWPEKFSTEDEQETERLRLHRVIERLVTWEATYDEAILNEARWEIARSVAWGLGEEPPPPGDRKAILAYLQEKAPPVYDPFSGGGSIPLEAQRLGLRAHGSDLNPVATLIGKALIEIPPKFAGRPPVNPNAQAELNRGGRWGGRGTQGLAEDVRYYGQRMREEAEKRIGHLYPKAKLEDGSEATVIAWLWARTVRSPDPAAKGAMVPLISNFMLASKPGKKSWIEIELDQSAPDGYRSRVRSGELTDDREASLKKGTKAGRGSNFICVLTGSSIEGDYIKSEGMAGRIGVKLMAVAAEGYRRRLYIDPSLEHEASGLPDISALEIIDAPTSTHPQYMGCVPYGIDNFGKMFTSRQMASVTTFADLVAIVRKNVLDDANISFAGQSQTRLAQDGSDAIAYADAVATYLAFAVSRTADLNNNLCRWEAGPAKELVGHLFSRQNIPIVWDFAEANPFSGSSGDWSKCLSYVTIYLDHVVSNVPGKVDARNAKEKSGIQQPVVSTDPPYYDNIPYADLSDFFYVWLRRSVAEVWPDLFRRLTVPKADELVADIKRHAGRDKAHDFFMTGMGEVLKNLGSSSSAENPMTIFYAFKQSESVDEGVTSAGWSSFLQAIVDSGLGVDGTWPIRTESTTGLKGTRNALASSIVLVCRQRSTEKDVTTRGDFIRMLRRELPSAIAAIRAAGVGPVDMQQSVIGPGMGVFTRYSEVLEDDDSKMTVKTALSIINRAWEEIDNEIVASFDPGTQVALAWFASYGFDPKPSGELITLANAKDTSIDDLFDAEVFDDLRGRAALKTREKLDPTWSPARDRKLTVWECVQHLARTLNSVGGGAQAAARLIAEMGPKATDTRALVDRLFQIATDKGWAQEALVYNQLAEEWPHLLDRSANIFDEVRPAETGDLFA
ncbi:MAG: DUF1156 domain-containing protein [Mesorhizobium sp.]|nr:MAG: DUF1156 domain-containing protein [Mesorhizobium sp.]TJW09050.1 MAG: DUF1156 domain-containing protein [Mesorhizobium sp.]